MKKLTSLLLSLLLCLCLLPGQAHAAAAPEGGPPVQTEASEEVQTDGLDELVAPNAEVEFPEKDTNKTEED